MGWCVAHPHLVRWVRRRLLVQWRVGFLPPLVGYSLQSVLLSDSLPQARWCCPLACYSVTHCLLERCPLARAMVIELVRSLCQPEHQRRHPYQRWFQPSGVGDVGA
jgi:hypothetical protein